MARAKTVRRLVIHLDTRVALEAVLLNRQECLPAARRQEWLRGLLMQGFFGECQALRGVPDRGTRRPSMAFSHRMTGQTQRPLATRDQESMAMKEKNPANNAAGKPFVALGKVIG
jgi:hypothetical protein